MPNGQHCVPFMFILQIVMGLGGQDSTIQDHYVCELPESSRKLALDELREDDFVRQQSLDQMREWINKNSNIKKCRTGNQPF